MCCNNGHCCCAEKPNPTEYTPEQTRECHGEAVEHPCERQAKEPSKE